jgi:DNA-binding XRE family transcriptional regulator
MAKKKTNWNELKKERMASVGARAGYEGARRNYEIGAQVKKMREKAGLSQKRLADLTNSTQPSIARLEAGGVNPHVDTLDRIASATRSELTLALKSRRAS